LQTCERHCTVQASSREVLKSGLQAFQDLCLGEKKAETSLLQFRDLFEDPLSPSAFNTSNFIERKKRESGVLCLLDSYFFLSIKAIIAMPTTAIAAIMPPIPGSKYWSATEAGGLVGATVGSGASITPKAVSVYEGQ